MTRVAPLAPPWSEADAADINSWGHPDRTYEPLLLVRCLQRHPALAARLRKLGEALYVEARLPARMRTIAILRRGGGGGGGGGGKKKKKKKKKVCALVPTTADGRRATVC